MRPVLRAFKYFKCRRQAADFVGPLATHLYLDLGQ